MAAGAPAIVFTFQTGNSKKGEWAKKKKKKKKTFSEFKLQCEFIFFHQNTNLK